MLISEIIFGLRCMLQRVFVSRSVLPMIARESTFTLTDQQSLVLEIE